MKYDTCQVMKYETQSSSVHYLYLRKKSTETISVNFAVTLPSTTFQAILPTIFVYYVLGENNNSSSYLHNVFTKINKPIIAFQSTNQRTMRQQ